MRRFFTLLAICLTMVFAAKAGEKQVYTEFYNGVLTYYCDAQASLRSGIVENYDPVNNPNAIRFREQNYYRKITKVVIDESMRDTLLPSMRYMFFGGYDDDEGKEYFLEKMTKIEGLKNLNTSNATDMNCMFYGCESLESLDLTKFNTEKVTDMTGMFSLCRALKSLNLRSFNTANVQKMVCMFEDCMSLESLNLSSFNTGKVMDMWSMFAYCASLKSLDLTSFDVTKVTDMQMMFAECHQLNTIYCKNDWSRKTAIEESREMFYNCYRLVGGNGTTYDEEYVDKKYARPDGLNGNPGYFSLPRKEVYTVFDPSTFTLTYYCDDKKGTHTEGIVEIYDPVNNPDAIRFREQDYNYYVTKAVIDESMKDTLLTSLVYMFYGGYDFYQNKEYMLEYMTDIEGLENLNTSGVEYMFGMFRGCESLESLDLTKFNTEKVTNMSYMFYDCASMRSIDLSSFNTSNVTDMSYMFELCVSLNSIDLSSFNTVNVKNMDNMFYRCSALPSIDLSSFNTGKVTRMYGMFSHCASLKSLNLCAFDVTKVETMQFMFCDCSELTTIYCNDDWSASPALNKSGGMFDGCTKLVGGRKTPYDANHVDKAYAHPDEGETNPGYFTLEPKDVYTVYDEFTKTLTYYCDKQRAERAGDGIVIELYTPEKGHDQNRFAGYANQIKKVVIDESFNDAQLESLADMFNGGVNTLQSLEKIEGLDNIDFSYVTDMYAMFYECRSLTSIDFSSFNTSNVTNMEYLFRGCSSLKALDLFGFDVTKVEEMSGMFYDCSELTTIYCTEDWSQSTVLQNSNLMFGNCYKLVGEQDSYYNPNYADCKSIVYARPDGGEEHPGYFTTTYPTAIDQITNDQSPITNKVLRDGQLLIERSGKTFNVLGTQVY